MSQVTNTETAAETGAPERSEEPLRPLTGRDWVIGLACGAALAGLMAAASGTAPDAMFIPLVLTGFGLGLLAYLDHVTHLILNTHTLAFAVLAGVSLALPAAEGYGTWGPAAAAAVLVFLFMLAVTLTGFSGGGDMKLAPVPAAVLAVVSPLAACMWMLLTFLTCLIYQIVTKVSGTQKQYAAMAPFMAVALAPALIISSVVTTSMGLP